MIIVKGFEKEVGKFYIMRGSKTGPYGVLFKPADGGAASITFGVDSIEDGLGVLQREYGFFQGKEIG